MDNELLLSGKNCSTDIQLCIASELGDFSKYVLARTYLLNWAAHVGLHTHMYFNLGLQHLDSATAADIKFEVDAFYTIALKVANIAINSSNFIAGAQGLSRFLRKCDNSKSILRILHVRFVTLCLQAISPHTAEFLLNEPVLDIQSREIESLDYLSYFYYGAVIYLALKKFDRAVVYLETVLTCPVANNICSAIQIDAMPKYLLAQLLRDGQIGSNPLKKFPKTIQQYYSRLWSSAGINDKAREQSFDWKTAQYGQREAVTYCGLTRSFLKADIAGFEKEMKEKEKVLTRDSNLGLVKQCLKELILVRPLMDVARCYSRIPLHDLHYQIGYYPETTLIQVASTANVKIRLNPVNGAVTFPMDDQSDAYEDTYNKVLSACEEIMRLSTYLTEFDKNLQTSDEYVRRVLLVRTWHLFCWVL
eukprot:Filipodium_phascolosomae@DN2605_c0_g1_i4.p1